MTYVTGLSHKRAICRGFLVFIVFQESWNALMWTAQNGHTEVAKLLLERGARVDMQDKVLSILSLL